MAEKQNARISEEAARQASEQLRKIVDNVEQIIVGKRPVIELVVLALIADGHVLIEDVPGVGKTTLVSSVARSVDCDFHRIQFTPDLMPSDVTGFSVYNQKTGEFEFRPGSVMSNLILADEINRASAKTQASLLEAMGEKQVTVDSTTYFLDEPFMVLATQNPLESFGTYPLPEAQVDRFLLKISIGYPNFEEEVAVITRDQGMRKTLQPAVSKADVLQLREAAKRVYVSRQMAEYIVQLVGATRGTPELLLGSSPRGSISLYQAARVWALFQGRSYVTPDDIKYLAPYVLPHRLILSHEAKAAKRTATQVVETLLDRIAIPLAGDNT
ncbi:MAG: MoxR family ATPase [Oscillospiraceae bacterium]|nr:MoxR family ATPase [Oscillospiraceae bacterium]